VQPRVIRMVWDVDSESTKAIMKDVGVSLLTTDTGRNTALSHCASKSEQSQVSS